MIAFWGWYLKGRYQLVSMVSLIRLVMFEILGYMTNDVELTMLPIVPHNLEPGLAGGEP